LNALDDIYTNGMSNTGSKVKSSNALEKVIWRNLIRKNQFAFDEICN
jgi:hypothetical protein